MLTLIIRILGTRGEIESSRPYHSHHTGLLIDNQFLFDLGEEEFLSYDPQSIFITHLHPDHAFFVRDSFKKTVQFSVPIYAPEKYKDNPEIKKVKDELNINSYSIRSIPTHHSKKVESCSYLISKDDQCVLYTGDLIWINKQYHHLFECVDLVITEASFIRKDGRIRRDKKTGKIYGHSGIPRLISLFSDHTDHILFIHFGEWFYEDISKARRKLKKLGRKHDVSVIVGYDGLSIDTKALTV